MSKHEEKVCQRCRALFECKIGSIHECQCSDIVLSDAMRHFLEISFFDCLCINCLRDLNDKLTVISGLSLPKSSEYTGGVHFYIENGHFVFTETYFLLRGYCCQNGCRHCPYGFSLVE